MPFANARSVPATKGPGGAAFGATNASGSVGAPLHWTSVREATSRRSEPAEKPAAARSARETTTLLTTELCPARQARSRRRQQDAEGRAAAHFALDLDPVAH